MAYYFKDSHCILDSKNNLLLEITIDGDIKCLCERAVTELLDTVVDPKAVEVVVAYLPCQEIETSDGFPCTISLVDPVDYARSHDWDSVYGMRFSSL